MSPFLYMRTTSECNQCSGIYPVFLMGRPPWCNMRRGLSESVPSGLCGTPSGTTALRLALACFLEFVEGSRVTSHAELQDILFD